MQAFERGSAAPAMESANRAKKCTASRTPARHSAVPGPRRRRHRCVYTENTERCRFGPAYNSKASADKGATNQTTNSGQGTASHQRESLFRPSKLASTASSSQPTSSIHVPLGLFGMVGWSGWPRGPTMSARVNVARLGKFFQRNVYAR